MLELLRELERITATSRGCTRIAYTDDESVAHDCVWSYLDALSGLSRVADAAGNMFIAPESCFELPHRPVILIGSHLDTVIEGGWLDGTLGVAAAVDVVKRLAPDGTAQHPVGVVVFRDEEGVRFNTGLFGSKVFAGLCKEEDLEVRDRDGVSVRDCVSDADGCLQYEPPLKPAAFLECHIEQGLRLMDAGARVGVVTAIVGIRRFELVSRGVPNHAGTTEMARREDALVPVGGIVSELPSLVADLEGAVITCGRMSVLPGAPNIVPGIVRAIVEIRAQDRERLDVIESRFRQRVAEWNTKWPAELQVQSVVDVQPTETHEGLVNTLVECLEDARISYRLLPSMAGHDTQNAARACPAGMFFIPSLNGVSHSPDENSTNEDIVLAGDLMLAWVRRALQELEV